jgi:hypothetical protein
METDTTVRATCRFQDLRRPGTRLDATDSGVT